MEVFEVSIDGLIPDPNNARTHDDKNLSAIKGSLAKFKQQTPIVIDSNNVVLKGNGTVEAAKLLGWKSIKAVKSDLTTNVDKTAYALADNRSSELADWDDDILGKVLQALYEDGFEIGDIGFELPSLDDDPEKLMEGFSEGDAGERKESELTTCPNCGVAIEAK